MAKKPVLRRGSVGDAVVELQHALFNLGLYHGQKDGLFGPNTERSVVKYQRREKLSVDGIVGNQVWNRLAEKPDPLLKGVPHTLDICRVTQTPKSTVSKVKLINDETREILWDFVILERPGPDTTTPGRRKRIPEGWYSMKWQTRTGLRGVQPHLPVPWLYNDDVPEERYIYIHNGNYPDNTDGCLLTGKTTSPDFVSHSVDTLDKLKEYLEDIGITNVRVHVHSEY